MEAASAEVFPLLVLCLVVTKPVEVLDEDEMGALPVFTVEQEKVERVFESLLISKADNEGCFLLRSEDVYRDVVMLFNSWDVFDFHWKGDAGEIKFFDVLFVFRDALGSFLTENLCARWH